MRAGSTASGLWPPFLRPPGGFSCSCRRGVGRRLAEVFPHQAHRVGQTEILKDDRDVRGRIEVRGDTGLEMVLEVDDRRGELDPVAVQQACPVIQLECGPIIGRRRCNVVHRFAGCLCKWWGL